MDLCAGLRVVRARTERRPSIPSATAVRPEFREAALSGLAAFVLMAPIGALALAFREPLLFPSLGPTVFIQVHAPRAAAARPWNNLVGHGLGIAAAVLALWLTGATHVHTLGQVSQPLITWRRELAGAIAVGLTTAGQVVLRAAHPPAAATTLLIALGAIAPEWRAIAIIVAGILLTVVLERAIRPWLLRRQPDSEPHRAGEVGERQWS